MSSGQCSRAYRRACETSYLRAVQQDIPQGLPQQSMEGLCHRGEASSSKGSITGSSAVSNDLDEAVSKRAGT